MLDVTAGKNLHTYVPDYVAFDIETTGMSFENDEVTEIAAEKVQNGRVVDVFSTLVNPGISIPPKITELNGISDDMVKDSPDFKMVLNDFLALAGDSVLVGHNISTFDLKFLYRDARRFWGKTIGNDFADTLELSRAYLPDLPRHRLTDLAEHFGINPDGAHRALADCRMTQKLYECIKKEIENPAEAVRNARKCPRCGGILIKKHGKYGKFLGCLNYPDCRYTENLK